MLGNLALLGTVASLLVVGWGVLSHSTPTMVWGVAFICVFWTVVAVS